LIVIVATVPTAYTVPLAPLFLG